MKLTRLLASLALAASASAHAADARDLGVLDQGGTSFGALFWRFFDLGSAYGAFTDHYTFQLLGDSTAQGGAAVSMEWGSLDLDLNSVSLSGGTLAGTVTDTTPQNFSFSGLGKGTYSLDISGVLKNIGGSTGVAYYSGSIQSIASAAPEPEALALLVAGLLGVGAMTARRKKA